MNASDRSTSPWSRTWVWLVLAAVVGGCAAPAKETPPPPPAPPVAVAPPPPPAAPPPPPAPPPILPFNDAVMLAANNLFKAAPAATGKSALVIDPLIDGNSGVESVATRSMGRQVGELVKNSYPAYELQPFGSATLSKSQFMFIGTFTAVDAEGKVAGPKEWYRVCLALLDLRSGKIVSKGFARARPDGVDITPARFFLDAPAWAPDPAVEGYVKTCQGTKAGDAINPAYWDRLVAAATLNDAVQAYEAGNYKDALELYKAAAQTPAGDQLRVYNGMYLAATKLGRRQDAAMAFNRIVDFGLAQKRLGVKFLFRPGSTLFIADPKSAGPYPTWLRQIADRAGRQSSSCMQVSGHTSRTGAEPLNERLSAQRAQFIKRRLDTDAPQLASRISAVGKGSQENITGLGTDDARDALDRRVEFKVVDCSGV